ncbi:MAG: rod shape-determining protein RodA [Steroidobacteraceae bacterium]
MIYEELNVSRARRTMTATAQLLRALHLDGPLLATLGLVVCFGLLVLYSAAGENVSLWTNQIIRFGIAVVVMTLLAQVPPPWLRMITPWLYAAGVVLLVAVAVLGDIGKGAQRWLDLGIVRFQPSEMMKLAVPMACAWYAHARPLPPSFRDLVVFLLIILVPAGLIAEQPDLGTALLVSAAGGLVVLFAGLQLRYLIGGAVLAGIAIPVGWHFLHDYQRQRVLTFLDPQTDPLGAGYHIIQSQIAIGSGGVFGKGWMHGSQAQLEFLPERTTDFIFAVVGEELGLLGQCLLLAIYLVVIGRALWMANQCRDTFSRLTAGALAMTFFIYVFVNSGMVSGLLPVVGVPLPLFSYGGTSMVTLLAGFGILMSLYANRKLVSS